MLFTSAALIVTDPVGPSQMVKLWQAIFCPTVSTTFTVERQVEVFPLASVTVKVTELLPD